MTAQKLSPSQQNAINSQLLLQTGVSMVKQLPAVSATIGGPAVQIPLQRMGILTGVMLDVNMPLTIGTASLVQSMFGPFNLFSNIKYTDFAGVNRVNTTGYSLAMLHAFRKRELSGTFGTSFTGVSNMGNIDTNIFNFPTAVGTTNLHFQLYVPIAYDAAGDLRGSVLAQTTLGDHYLTITPAAAVLGSTNSDNFVTPYTVGTTGTASAGNINITAYQHYIQPQTNDPNMLPLIDLSTVYGIDGNFTSTSNITANMANYQNLPNNQAILSSLYVFDNGGNGTVNGTDLTKISLIVNSNTIFREFSPGMLRGHMREMLGADVAPGTYYLGSRRQPILTQLFGNVQTKFDVATVSGTGVVQFISQYESFYPSGAPLPGVMA